MGFHRRTRVTRNGILKQKCPISRWDNTIFNYNGRGERTPRGAFERVPPASVLDGRPRSSISHTYTSYLLCWHLGPKRGPINQERLIYYHAPRTINTPDSVPECPECFTYEQQPPVTFVNVSISARSNCAVLKSGRSSNWIDHNFTQKLQNKDWRTGKHTIDEKW